MSALARARERARDEARAWQAAHAGAAERYRGRLGAGVRARLDALRAGLREVSGGNPLCDELGAELERYLDWLQWTLWDLPWLAAALAIDEARFEAVAGSAALVYLSLRLVDDVIDRHYDYRGRADTLLSRLVHAGGREPAAERLAYLGALLLCFEGLHALAGADEVVLRQALASLRRTMIGAIMEQDPRRPLTRPYYARMIELKNVDYARILFAAVDPELAAPLVGFLGRHALVAQKLNDLEEHPEDERRDQPNLVSLHLAAGDDASDGAWPPAVVAELASDLAAQADAVPALPPAQRGVAWLLLDRHFAACEALGLRFVAGCPPPAPPPRSAAHPLDFSATLEQVLGRHGPTALERVACPVCGGADDRTYFHSQGFRVARCAACGHAHVNPRVREALQRELGAALESELDPFLAAQKLSAPQLCALLEARTEGRRLLDVGPGRGYFLELARARGFDVHALEPAPTIVEHLRAKVGRRVHHGALGDPPLPWGSFDAVVVSHVLEHVAWPVPALEAVRHALRPGGLVYLAVPDVASMHLRVLGRRWPAIAPLAHYHYFSADTLDAALRRAGFSGCERVPAPPLPRALTPRWAHLFRKLGGDEVGEVRMLAWRPALADADDADAEDGP